ncbi:hypothetical protein ABTZ21_36880 [Streptomyces sp. NPDC096191]|uniref:hypothetical protein n=1 Tax=Streptomyces sp. NPDC096191 TaxID=3155426 RepID=UPI0033277B83
MSSPGRRLPAFCAARRRHRPHNRLTRAVRYAGRLLCWSLAAGMTTAATELLLTPQADWWQALWPAPWYLTPLAALTWAVLRAREKAEQHPPDEDTLPEHWDQAA